MNEFLKNSVGTVGGLHEKSLKKKITQNLEGVLEGIVGQIFGRNYRGNYGKLCGGISVGILGRIHEATLGGIPEGFLGEPLSLKVVLSFQNKTSVNDQNFSCITTWWFRNHVAKKEVEQF